MGNGPTLLDLVARLLDGRSLGDINREGHALRETLLRERQKAFKDVFYLPSDAPDWSRRWADAQARIEPFERALTALVARRWAAICRENLASPDYGTRALVREWVIMALSCELVGRCAYEQCHLVPQCWADQIENPYFKHPDF